MINRRAFLAMTGAATAAIALPVTVAASAVSFTFTEPQWVDYDLSPEPWVEEIDRPIAQAQMEKFWAVKREEKAMWAKTYAQWRPGADQ